MTMKRKWAPILAAFFFCVLLFFHFDWYEVFIFQDGTLPKDYTFQLNHDFEEITLKANDGASINCLLLKTKNPPKGIILYFHGNRNNLSRWANECAYLTNYGYQVLVMDYRGYGKSTGLRNEANFYADAYLAYQKCKKSFPSEKIIAYGRSLGSGPACWLAANAELQALVLETPYTRFTDLIEQKVLGLPMRWFLDYQFDNLSQLKNITEPVLIIHGTDDKLIPISHAQTLTKACQHPNSTFLIVQGGGHNNLPTYQTYKEGLDQFLKMTNRNLSQ